MKRSHSRAASLAVALLLLLSTVPAGVAAQGEPGGVLLNQHTTAVGSATVDGDRYRVYRHENAIPYASGLSVVHEGRPVTDEALVTTVLSTIAERRAAGRLGPQDVEDLRTIRREARILANATGTSADTLSNATAYLAHLRDVRVDGTTAWNASTDAAPALTEFNETATRLVPELRTTERYAEQVVSNATALIDLLERRRNGSGVDPQRIYARYETTLSRIGELTGQEYDVDELARVAALSERVAGNVTSVPERGDALARRLRTVANGTALAANRTAAAFEALDAVTGYGSPIEDPQEFAESWRSDALQAWHERRYAPRDVYATLIGVPVALVAGVGYLRRRR